MSSLFTIVGVSGSLRAASLNTRFLHALSLACPQHIVFHIYDKLGSIPPFNVDADEKPPKEVLDWKAFLEQSDMIVLASPEYAHGISGVLKNALDWLVSDYQLLARPISFPNISVRASIAQKQMEEILNTMGFSVIDSCSPRASTNAPLINPDLSAEEIAAHPILSLQLTAFWKAVSNFLIERAL